MHFPPKFMKKRPPTFSMVHLLYRLYGVDAPGYIHYAHVPIKLIFCLRLWPVHCVMLFARHIMTFWFTSFVSRTVCVIYTTHLKASSCRGGETSNVYIVIFADYYEQIK